MYIIVASGFWNGAQRKLYWSQSLPTFAWWEGSAERVIVFAAPADAEDDLEAAHAAMLNRHLAVTLEPADTLGGCRPSSL